MIDQCFSSLMMDRILPRIATLGSRAALASRRSTRRTAGCSTTAPRCRLEKSDIETLRAPHLAGRRPPCRSGPTPERVIVALSGRVVLAQDAPRRKMMSSCSRHPVNATAASSLDQRRRPVPRQRSRRSRASRTRCKRCGAAVDAGPRGVRNPVPPAAGPRGERERHAVTPGRPTTDDGEEREAPAGPPLRGQPGSGSAAMRAPARHPPGTTRRPVLASRAAPSAAARQRSENSHHPSAATARSTPGDERAVESHLLHSEERHQAPYRLLTLGQVAQGKGQVGVMIPDGVLDGSTVDGGRWSSTTGCIADPARPWDVECYGRYRADFVWLERVGGARSPWVLWQNRWCAGDLVAKSGVHGWERRQAARIQSPAVLEASARSASSPRCRCKPRLHLRRHGSNSERAGRASPSRRPASSRTGDRKASTRDPRPGREFRGDDPWAG